MRDLIELKVRDKTYRIRPTFGALVAIEERLGRSVLALMESVERATDVKVRDVVGVLYEALCAMDVEIEYDDLGEVVVEQGVLSFVGIMMKYLGAAMTAGPEKPAAGETKSKQETDQG